MKKSIRMLLAILLCFSCFACSLQDTTSQKTSDNQEEIRTETAEVVIIGGGAAGMAAALKAAENGLNVVLLEKQAFLGGASIMASTGINAGSSRLQLETENPYTDEMFYEYALSWDYGYDRLGYRVVPVRDDMAYTFAYKSAEAADWIGSLGVEMKASDNSHSLQLVTKENGAFGEVYVSALTKALNDNDKIEIRTESRAVEIRVDDNGAVCGVVVEDKTGSYLIETTAVLLATGGYASADSNFYQKYAAEWDGYYSYGAAGASGDGIVMADALNAKLEGMEAVTCTTVAVGEENQAGAKPVNASLKQGTILINKNGERFVNEMTTNGDLMEAMKAQPDQFAYLIADETIYAASADLQALSNSSDLIEAETVEELAEKLNLDATRLAATLEQYTQDAVSGQDAFEKTEFPSDLSEGKYYAVLVKPARRITTGGIVIDGKAQVLNTSDEVIEGLYAAGETTAYGAHPLSASTIFGRVAADSITEFLKKGE